MKTKQFPLILAAAISLMLCSSAPAEARTVVTLMSSGDGLFSLQGIGFEGVSAMDITITYDPATAANPQVFQDKLIAGAVMTVNAREPGLLRISVFRDAPLLGTGDIARIVFERKGDAQGSVTSLNVRMTDLRGAPLQVQTQFLNSSDSPAGSGQPWSDTASPASGNAPAATPGTPAAPPIAAPGTSAGSAEIGAPLKATLPPGVPEPAPSRPVPSRARSVETARRGPEPAADPSTRVKKVVVSQMSVLERFEEFKGSRTPQALIGLFDQDPLFGCRQDPSPVLADGRATAKVSFIAQAELKAAPDIAMMNASLVSIERDRENTNTWIATVQPQRGSTDARMIISLPDKTLIIPLTVSPKVMLPPGASGAVTEKEFAAYLKGDGGKGSPERDLNGDGIVNHLDFYIFTANYLAGRQRADSAPPPGR